MDEWEMDEDSLGNSNCNIVNVQSPQKIYKEWQMMLGYQLWPLHTRAKSRDQGIVRAQKELSKGCPKPPPKSCSVVTDPPM